MPGVLVDLVDVTFAWPGRHAFAMAVSRFQVDRGERVLLFGPSGSGKSTLLSLICGIVRPSGGHISLLGTDIAQLNDVARDRFRAAHVGVIFQQFNLLPYASLVDNVVLPLSFAPERRRRARAGAASEAGEAKRLLAALGLGAIAPDTPASNLSIGQQQRVAVARALIGAPELVIADEPTSALDSHAQTRFLDLMFAQLGETGAGLIMVSHDERLASRFDRVVELSELIKPSHGGAADAMEDQPPETATAEVSA